MKKYIYSSLFVFAISLIYFLGSKHAPSDRVVSETKSIFLQKGPRIEVQDLREVVAHTPARSGKVNAKMRTPSSKESVKQTKRSQLDSFPKLDVEFFEGKFLLVDGAFASLDLLPGKKIIADLGGFFIYEHREVNSFQVVYDIAKKQYGVFTGEVIVKGNYSKALSIIEQSSFEVVYKNDLIQQVIFKVENVQDLSALSTLKEVPNVELIPDLKFARAKRM